MLTTLPRSLVSWQGTPFPIPTSPEGASILPPWVLATRSLDLVGAFPPNIFVNLLNVESKQVALGLINLYLHT